MAGSGEYVVGLGSVAMDIISEVNSLPKEDGFSLVDSQRELDGGSCANVLTQIARLDVPAAMIAQVGDDEIGKQIIESLRSEKINTTNMLLRKGGSSFFTQVLVAPDGSKTIVLHKGDSLLTLAPAQIKEDLIKECRVFYTDLFPYAPALRAAELAKKSKGNVVFNMQVELSLMSRLGITEDKIHEFLNYTDVFIPCRVGAKELTGADDPADCLEKLRERFNFDGIIILTQGEKGSIIDSIDGDACACAIPAFEVVAKDTTGAGDCYAGAFIVAYYYKGYSLEQAGLVASAAAALNCTHLGARTVFGFNDVKSFLIERGIVIE